MPGVGEREMRKVPKNLFSYCLGHPGPMSALLTCLQRPPACLRQISGVLVNSLASLDPAEGLKFNRSQRAGPLGLGTTT